MHEQVLLNAVERITGFTSKYNYAAWEVGHTIYIFATGENEILRKQAQDIRDHFVKMASIPNIAESDPVNLDKVKLFIKKRGESWFNRASNRPRDKELSDYEVEGILKSMLRDIPAMFGSWDNFTNWE